jgi:hypothetical protein
MMSGIKEIPHAHRHYYSAMIFQSLEIAARVTRITARPLF